MRRSGLGGAVLVLVVGLSLPAVARADDGTQADLIGKLLPSVVNITAHTLPAQEQPMMASSSPPDSDSFEVKTSAGSGFIIDADGTILTNWHVVAGAFEVFVTLSDGTRLDAEVVNAARLVDLALLKVKPDQPLQAVAWADSNQVKVGESVFAIGNPLGIGMSVSRGIVSALHRNISDTPYDDFIQTDAAINHGNSGGPLFNTRGEVIGVDSAIISPTAANAGLGFALPAYQAQFVIKQLKQYGWVRPGWMGVKIQDVTEDMARALGMAKARGSVVAWIVAGGPAEQGGLRIGDVVVRFEEDSPADERALLRDISGSWPGRVVKLGVIRGGKEIEVTTTLAEWPRMAWEEINAPLKVPMPRWVIPADLGITLSPMTAQLRAENEVPPGQTGVMVSAVSHGTDAARRGLQPGDVILQVGDVAVDSEAAVMREVEAVRKSGRDMAAFLVFPKNAGAKAFPSPKWIPLRVRAG